MMQSYFERINQQREQEALLATQREQELREQEQAAQEKEEPPQNSDFRQLIGELCGTKFCEEQKQNIEDTMLEFLEDCRQKELYCMHNDVNDLIESALNSKLLSINLKSQRLDKEKQEVKNIMEQPTKCKTRIIESLQNFRVIHKMSSISNTTISKMESDKIVKSSVKNHVQIPSKSEVTSDNENDLMPPGIENDDYDSKGDIHFFEELLSNDSLPIPKNKSSNFDHHDHPSFSRPPPEPLDVEILFDLEPDTGVLAAKVMEEIYVLMSKVLPTQPALYPNIDPLLSFSSETRTKYSNLAQDS
nr:hypothetical protein [Tanacetum cinerariifolium]